MLVVEDEPLLRIMAVDMVADAGFDVVEAADPFVSTTYPHDKIVATMQQMAVCILSPATAGPLPGA